MSAPSDLSVVIPTHNGGGVLHRALEALQAQDAPRDRFEIIVVDDGSTDGSTEGLQAKKGPVALRLLRQANRGIAAARNLGAAEAKGRALLFVDADVWATPGLVSAHLAYHASRRDLGVQGRLVQHPDSLTTFFMRAQHRVMIHSTWRRREGMSPFHVISRNFSVDADAFRRASGFDEGFRGYGWEDIELAYRLVRSGVTLRYEPTALAHHFHIQTLDELREKLRQAGEGAVYFWRKHDRDWRLGLFLEILPVLLPLKWLVYRSGIVTAALRPVLRVAERAGLLVVCGELYSHLIWQSFYDGVFAGMRQPPEQAVGQAGAQRS
ncbi:MAG: glycosyltransferase [Armatimonadetes bacterium]|nr:glycosyltransferase [Armatimonadota bacterium]